MGYLKRMRCTGKWTFARERDTCSSKLHKIGSTVKCTCPFFTMGT